MEMVLSLLTSSWTFLSRRWPASLPARGLSAGTGVVGGKARFGVSLTVTAPVLLALTGNRVLPCAYQETMEDLQVLREPEIKKGQPPDP